MINKLFPIYADEKYITYIKQIEELKIANFSKSIPNDLYNKNIYKGMAGFMMSYCLYIGSIIGTYFSPYFALTCIFLVLSGLGGWGLHCIAHDCGHGAFSNSKKLNYIIGHLSLIPLLYPFHSWRHTHNMHHGSTNHLEMDTDWLPITREVYNRMSFKNRIIYIFTRSIGFWSGTIHYWWVSAFRPAFYSKRKDRDDVRRSIVFIGVIGFILFIPILHYTGLHGLLLYFLLPLISTHIWFSITTLMHHTAPDVPFLSKENWALNGSRILLVTNYIYPKWLSWLTHNISIHSAHHVAPTIPFYNLPKVHKVLKNTYPSMVRETPFRIKILWEIITQCHFYDSKTGYYISYKNSNLNK